MASTLTVDNIVGATSASKVMIPGHVVQVVMGEYSTTATSTSGTIVDTGLSATITPTSSSSKVVIMVSQSFGKGGENVQIDAYLIRGSTNIVNEWLNDDVRTGDTQTLYLPPASLVYLDSPSTTSATTYKTQFRNAAGSGTVYANNNNGKSKMILMEIAQ